MRGKTLLTGHSNPAGQPKKTLGASGSSRGQIPNVSQAARNASLATLQLSKTTDHIEDLTQHTSGIGLKAQPAAVILPSQSALVATVCPFKKQRKLIAATKLGPRRIQVGLHIMGRNPGVQAKQSMPVEACSNKSQTFSKAIGRHLAEKLTTTLSSSKAGAFNQFAMAEKNLNIRSRTNASPSFKSYVSPKKQANNGLVKKYLAKMRDENVTSMHEYILLLQDLFGDLIELHPQHKSLLTAMHDWTQLLHSTCAYEDEKGVSRIYSLVQSPQPSVPFQKVKEAQSNQKLLFQSTTTMTRSKDLSKQESKLGKANVEELEDPETSTTSPKPDSMVRRPLWPHLSSSVTDFRRELSGPKIPKSSKDALAK